VESDASARCHRADFVLGGTYRAREPAEKALVGQCAHKRRLRGDRPPRGGDTEPTPSHAFAGTDQHVVRILVRCAPRQSPGASDVAETHRISQLSRHDWPVAHGRRSRRPLDRYLREDCGLTGHAPGWRARRCVAPRARSSSTGEARCADVASWFGGARASVRRPTTIECIESRRRVRWVR